MIDKTVSRICKTDERRPAAVRFTLVNIFIRYDEFLYNWLRVELIQYATVMLIISNVNTNCDR